MRRFILCFLTVLILCSPLVTSAYAGQIQAKQLSQTEAHDMATLEADSATLIMSIEGGEADGMVIVFAVLGLLACLAAAAA